jgi:hypothetical protein
MEENKHVDSAAPKSAGGPQHATTSSAKLANKKIVWVAAGLAVLALLAGVVFALTSKDDTKQKVSTQKAQSKASSGSANNTGQSLFMQQYGNSCKEGDVKFTSAPMKMSDLAYIRPLGAMSDGHVTPTDHVYIGGPNVNAADNTYAVLMPADGTVADVSAMPAQYIGDRSGQQVAQEDHRIVISHSCRYFSIYIHIHKLSDKLKNAVGTLQPNESKRADVELKAGEVVGYIGGSTFDWTPIDTSVTLKGFITPSRYDGESWKVHTVSPFDLYDGSLKAELEAKSIRSVAPLGGKIDYDQPGKLIGNWFREGSGGYSGTGQNEGRYWDGHLSVVPDYIDPTSTIVSIGNWTGSAQQFVVSGSVDPSKIGEQDGVVKYELKRLNYQTANNQGLGGGVPPKGLRPSQSESVQGTIVLQVLSGEKLKVEKFPGKTAAQVAGFTSAAQTYER